MMTLEFKVPGAEPFQTIRSAGDWATVGGEVLQLGD